MEVIECHCYVKKLLFFLMKKELIPGLFELLQLIFILRGAQNGHESLF